MASIQWNRQLTDMIRNNRPSLWGNWALNTFIEVGAIGAIDTETGDFTFFDTLQSKETKRKEISSHWSMMSTDVKKSGGTTDISGKFDPTTGKEVKVEAHVKWDFSESGQLVSKFQTTYALVLNNRGNQIAQQMQQILNVATANGYAEGGQITQGFGVITEVIYGEAGLNIGAQTSSSSFSISGSVDGMAGMTDNDQAKASLKGSYFSDSQSGSFDSHIWPAAANELASSNIPVAFVVSSFGPNNSFIPIWVNYISEFTIYIDNANGGTWVVDVDVYKNYGAKDQASLGSTKVSGGSHGTISSIPLDVHNLGIVVNYETGPTHLLTYPTPLTLIPTGDLLVDIYGLAGGSASLETHVIPPGVG